MSHAHGTFQSVASRDPLLRRLREVFLRTWYLGFTSFGGPVVHFQIFYRNFVEGKNPWLDEQTVSKASSYSISSGKAFPQLFSRSLIAHEQYREMFAVCQSLPGPASTKMLFCIALLRGGILSALMTFLTWRYAYSHTGLLSWKFCLPPTRCCLVLTFTRM